MRWLGLYIEAYSPEGSVTMPYSWKQRRTYSWPAAKVTYTPQRRSRKTGRPSRSTLEITSTWPRWCRCPPSAFGRSTRARSSTPQGGNSSPPGAARSPVAFATAAISMALFVPSRKELNICALKSPLATVSGVKP